MYTLTDDQLDEIVHKGQQRMLFAHHGEHPQGKPHCTACWSGLKYLIQEVAQSNRQTQTGADYGQANLLDDPASTNPEHD